jgi:hypothetical protein
MERMSWVQGCRGHFCRPRRQASCRRALRSMCFQYLGPIWSISQHGHESLGCWSREFMMGLPSNHWFGGQANYKWDKTDYRAKAIGTCQGCHERRITRPGTWYPRLLGCVSWLCLKKSWRRQCKLWYNWHKLYEWLGVLVKRVNDNRLRVIVS